MNPFPQSGGDPEEKGKSLKHFSRGEGALFGSSRRKGGDEVMGWREGEGKQKGEGGGRREGGEKAAEGGEGSRERRSRSGDITEKNEDGGDDVT